MYDHLYLHVPFCAGKCSYCAFYSEPYSSKKERNDFVVKLINDIASHGEKLQNLKTIFIGGGTPTLLAPHDLEVLLKGLRQTVNLRDDFEFSVENNPEALTPEKLEILGEHGVNRLSFGIQSFSKRLRNEIGRIGDINKLDNLVDKALTLGLKNISFDFIYGIPSQTFEQWRFDMQEAANYPLSHLSAYSLTIEEGTSLSKQKVQIDDETAVEMQNWTINFLRESLGMERYEISNYSKKDRHCRHNYGIWMGDSYLGLGPSAASFDKRLRWQEPSDLHCWMNKEKPEVDSIPPEARAREVFMIGLRTINGWNLQNFEQQTGFKVEKIYGSLLDQLTDQGLIKQTGHQLALTDEGLLYADYVGEQLI